MKTANFLSSIVITAAAVVGCANAAGATSVLFPDQKIGSPSLSLDQAAKEFRSILSPSESASASGNRNQSAAASRIGSDKFVLKPDTRVDYKLVIKLPNPSVDYRLIVKNSDAEQKK